VEKNRAAWASGARQVVCVARHRACTMQIPKVFLALVIWMRCEAFVFPFVMDSAGASNTTWGCVSVETVS